MIGSVFEERFVLNGFLAEGPIFTLYSARDKAISKDVSFRLLKPPFESEESFKSALKKAIEASSVIHSPFVERLLTLNSDSEKSYVIGELTRAPSLSDRIRKLAPFTAPVAVSTAISIGRGLEAFHKATLVHGDVSGDNVAMLADGETKLQLGGVWTAYSASTTAGVLVLPAMAAYLAPEVSTGDSPSAASDLYAVGILLFELLTGRKPYQADSGLATAIRHTHDETPRVKQFNQSIPPVLDEIVFKAMAKNVESRYGSASEFLFDLRQAQDALRFGRNLSWPINAKPAVAVETKSEPAPRPAPIPKVAPQPTRKRKEEKDVPAWMLLLFLGAAAAVVALLAVNFLVGATSPRLVTVPNLTGLTLSEAKTTLGQLHLKARTGSTVLNDRVEADRIVGSVPPAGQKLPENSVITVDISEGSREVAVPQLRTMTPDKAREVLSTVNLQLDDRIREVDDPSVPEGTICRQTPQVGVKLLRNGKVRVAINTPGASPAPDSKRYIYTIRTTVKDVQEPVEVSIEMVDDSGTKEIFDEEKEPGDTITAETEGRSRETFRILYDGREVEKDEYVEGKQVNTHLTNPAATPSDQ